ncbi:MAG: GNAT family N-acetyltransferase [Actinomycetota bacterium]
MTAHTYQLSPLDLSAGGIAAMTALLRLVFPRSLHLVESVVEWEYKANPDGRAVGFNAWVGDDLVGHYATMPMRARLNEREERGLLSLNTATHPEHRGSGLFTRLANATYARAAEQGFGFVIGVANANSTHGFTKKLGFQLVSPLLVMAGVGWPRHKTGADPQYERVWHPDALRWRLAHPIYRYSVKCAGHLDLIYTERRQAGGRLLLAALDHDQLPTGLLPRFKGSAPYRIWIGSDCALDWTRRLFINVPVRFRPSPLNLIFKDLTGQGRSLDPMRVRFQAIDFDTL